LRLEILPAIPETETPQTLDALPILMVHGAWHNAGCWQLFSDYFRSQGHTCHAVSLRGHGGSDNDRSLKLTRLDGYVADVGRAVADLVAAYGRKPVLIGHSMGGLVVQKYLEQDPDIPHGVLLASSPIQGVWRVALSLTMRHPLLSLKANLTWSLWPYVGSPDLARDAFFSEDISAEDLAARFAALQDEAYLAFLDMLIFRLPKPARVKTPVLVLGGENDNIFSVPEVEATAHAYGTQAKIFKGMAHNMMQEKDWRDVADHILAEVSS